MTRRLRRRCGYVGVRVGEASHPGPPIQARIRGVAVDQTFGNNFPYRDGKYYKLDVPEYVRIKTITGEGDTLWVRKDVSAADRDVVGNVYEAVHTRLGELGLKPFVTDECLHDPEGRPVGDGSALAVRCPVDSAKTVGSFDAIVSEKVAAGPQAGQSRLGAVDVKYTETHADLKSHSSGFGLLHLKRNCMHFPWKPPLRIR